MQLLNHLLDFFSGLLGLLRQIAHLVGNHGKTATLFAGACRLDGRIECQQVGLFGNGANSRQDRIDVLAVAGQGLHYADRPANLFGQGADRV
ncbi:hypothetical protein D3C77_500770 [compost metagenome]